MEAHDFALSYKYFLRPHNGVLEWPSKSATHETLDFLIIRTGSRVMDHLCIPIARVNQINLRSCYGLHRCLSE